eukprot:COSAG01_NODE_6612_length_3574_cov_1.760207_4_plen_115_part_00
MQLDNGDVHWFCPHHAAMASGRVDLGWHSAPCCHTRSGAGTSAELVAARLWPVGAIPTPTTQQQPNSARRRCRPPESMSDVLGGFVARVNPGREAPVSGVRRPTFVELPTAQDA